MNKAIFLDRDGTINVEKDYLFRISDFEFLPGVIEALKLLQANGFLLIIITNQSGIARGYYTEEDYRILNDWMLSTLRSEGVEVSAVYYCPHHPEAKIEKYRKNCSCRKPKLGLYEQAVKDFNIDLSQSSAIGDKIRDCAICKTTECRGFLIADNEKTSVIEDVKRGKYERVEYAQDLLSAVTTILTLSPRNKRHTTHLMNGSTTFCTGYSKNNK